MELNDLKNAWNKFSSDDAHKHQLGEEAILEMLRNRTTDMIERIDRNIKIGFGLLTLLVLFFILDDFVLTPSLAEGYVVPSWICVIDGINTLFILGTFIYFNQSYRLVQKAYSLNNDLRNVLQSTINILYSYKKLFHVALTILLLVLTISFISGMFIGVELKATEIGSTMVDLSSTPEMVRKIGLGMVILLASISGLFILFRWGFRRLYGNSISKLKETLRELDEIE